MKYSEHTEEGEEASASANREEEIGVQIEYIFTYRREVQEPRSPEGEEIVFHRKECIFPTVKDLAYPFRHPLGIQDESYSFLTDHD